MWTLADLLATYGPLETSSGEEETIFSGVTIDSRQSIPGGLFVALPGERYDGHDFIPEALERGCRGALGRRDRLPLGRRAGLPVRVYEWDGERWLRSGPQEAPAVLVLVPETLEALQRLAARWRRRFSPVVIGVTGSVGKSTTKELIAAVLSRGRRALKSERSYNNEIGLPLALLGLRPEHEVVVLEMGTYGPGEIAHLAEIARPHIGVVTNVSHSHLERMGTLETIARAKSELPAALPPDGLAVLNGDEALIRDMAGVTRAAVLFYGLGQDCHYRAEEVESRGLEGIAFTLEAGGERRRLRCALPGRHSVYTALAAAAVGRHLGLSWDEIEAGLLDTSAQIRLLAVPAANGATLLDDTYNASPTSCRAALELLSELPGRKVAVLGDMLELGSYEEEGHRQVGYWAAEVVEELFLLGRRARRIGEAALERGMPAGRVHFAREREEVIRMLRERLRPGDIVLVKGSRAMEMEHIVAALRQKED
ncbi:MAG: UDP-N-acetylmuramoyl-tripeptide--D-alanyl-D-alanine ligase [Chloroflexia bacterium]